jgi:hypothetical protein
LKTGKKLDFSLPGYCVQMALYAQAELYDVVHDQFRPTPPINQDWGLLVHMPADKDTCEILWVDLEVGNYGAYLVREVREWRKSWKNGTYAAPVVDSPVDDKKVAAELGGELVQSDAAEWVEMMLPFVRSRINRLRDIPAATKQLLTFWPDGVPAPKALEDHEHVTLVLNLLDEIEAKHGLGWPEGDPRSQTVTHKDDGPVSNTFEGES